MIKLNDLLNIYKGETLNEFIKNISELFRLLCRRLERHRQ